MSTTPTPPEPSDEDVGEAGRAFVQAGKRGLGLQGAIKDAIVAAAWNRRTGPVSADCVAVASTNRGVNFLRFHAQDLIAQYGTVRKAADAIGLDYSYLYRLASGEKVWPSDDALLRLGLRRVVTYAHLESQPQPSKLSELRGLLSADQVFPRETSEDMLDAARYRWFRENAAREGRGYRLASAPGEQDQMPLKYRWHIDSKDLSTASLDAAIDAAMQSEQAKKGSE